MDDLEDLLDTPAVIAGERVDDLRTGVFRIMVFHADLTRRQRESARLRRDVARWVADGELEQRFANIVLMSLDRLLARHS